MSYKTTEPSTPPVAIISYSGWMLLQVIPGLVVECNATVSTGRKDVTAYNNNL